MAHKATLYVHAPRDGHAGIYVFDAHDLSLIVDALSVLTPDHPMSRSRVRELEHTFDVARNAHGKEIA